MDQQELVWGGIMGAANQIAPDVDLKFKKIAVLTDFSRNSDNALHYGAAFARENGACLTLAHAYIPPTCACAAPEIALAYQAFEAFRDSLESRLLGQTEAEYLRDVKCTILLREGDAADLMEDLSDADLIVLGTSGHTGLERAALGSTAEKIFRSSPIPVLTVGPRCKSSDIGKGQMNAVIFATNLSPDTAAMALPYAVSVARKHDAELILLHVLASRGVSFSFERAMASAEPLEKMKVFLPDNVDLRCRRTYVVGFGTPDEVILAEARNRKAGLIVLGARRSGLLGALARRFEDGTAYSVAANAPCPVLTVRES
jgi:nucleotide-binding universal stress UspA family protein